MVIQRWQSLLLLVAAIMMAVFTFCSLGQVQTPDFTYNFTSLGFCQEGIATDGETVTNYNTWYLFTISLTSMILLLIDIFLFRNLPLQKRVCLVCVLFIIATGATAGALGYNTFDNGEIGWSTVICAPVLALIATIMAYGRISKDYNIIQSADRIR